MSEQITVYVVDYGRTNLYMRYRDPVTGKDIAKTTGTRLKKEAQKKAGEWEAALREGRYKSPLKVTWDEFRERYETEVLPSLADNTFGKVQATFNSVADHSPVERLTTLTADRISHWQKQLRSAGKSEATIKGYSAHLKAALRWAQRQGLLHTVPSISMPKRVKGAKAMKGRPITTEEFERMLGKVVEVVGEQRAESWKRFLRGLWWSGLRLSEAVALEWEGHGLRVELSGKFPMFCIPAECQKSGKDQLLPVAPEFAEMLLAVPENERTGFVFSPAMPHGDGRYREARDVGRTLTAIGRAAGVKVNETAGKVKHASAHDLRRAFGTRWSQRIMPADLQQLMRHETIETTMAFYVGQNADETAVRLWSAISRTIPSTDQPPTCLTAGDPQPQHRSHRQTESV